MAYWHHPDGTPAPWGEGEFDWTHLQPLLPLLAACAVLVLRNWLGR